MRCFRASGFLVLLAITGTPFVHAVEVTDTSAPSQLGVPTPAELADVAIFFAGIPAVPPGSIVTPLRSGLPLLVNVGLDAPAPAQQPEAQNTEIAVLSLPRLSFDCPAATPVTVSISSSEILLTDRTFPSFAGFGMGITILDVRNPSPASPISAALSSVAAVLNVGVPATAPAVSYDLTFADLPFLNAVVGFEVSESVFTGGRWELAQVSYDYSQPPVLRYRYDDSGCLPLSVAAHSVPAGSSLSYALLAALMMLVGLVVQRARCT